MGKKRTKVGRPPNEVKRMALSLRVTPTVRSGLDSAAAQTGRSISQEAELRLEQSFWQEELLSQALRLAYGETLAGVLLTLGETIKLVGQLTKYSLEEPNKEKEEFEFTSWEDHPVVVRTAFGAAKKMLEIIADPSIAPAFAAPQEHVTGVAKEHAAKLGKVGYSAVVMVLKELQYASAGSRHEKWEEIRELLGPLAEGLPSAEKLHSSAPKNTNEK